VSIRRESPQELGRRIVDELVAEMILTNTNQKQKQENQMSVATEAVGSSNAPTRILRLAEHRKIWDQLGVSPAELGRGLVGAVVLITPAIAAALLEQRNLHNRKMSNMIVTRYSRALATGHWALNAAPIIFDSDGVLMDGQQRLHSSVVTGISFLTLVVTGVDPANMPTIDEGKPRSGGDVLQLTGIDNAARTSAMCGHVFRYQNQLISTARVSNEEILATLGEHPNLPLFGRYAYEASQEFSYFPGSSFAAYVYLFSMVDEALAHRFASNVISGLELGEGDPVLALRKAARRNRGTAKLPTSVMIDFFIKTWNGYIQNRSMTVLVMRAGEAHPRIAGLD
jgi:hypothetical protein